MSVPAPAMGGGRPGRIWRSTVAAILLAALVPPPVLPDKDTADRPRRRQLPSRSPAAA